MNAIAFILRHHQLLQSAKDNFASLLREVRAKRRRLEHTDINMSMCLQMRSITLVHVRHQLQNCRCPCSATLVMDHMTHTCPFSSQN